MRIILASPHAATMQEFIQTLEKEGATVITASTGGESLSFARSSAPNAVLLDERIPDMRPLDVLRELLMIDAMINAAVFTARSEEDFDEFFEGYGVLMPLPQTPRAAEAQAVLAKVRAVQF